MDEHKAFESDVSLLLSLAGFEVKGETLMGHKRIDLYAEERRLGNTRKVAVECKHYANFLTQAELTQIYANYLPLYKNNLIDEILVITRKGLTPSAQAMVLETRELSHLTYIELQNLIMDFSSYLLGLIKQYDDDGLSSYYVPLKTIESIDLENEVLHWVNESNKPLAILGSYGMGKTTFSRRLSFLLAKRALGNSRERIPIFIRLGEISSEQSLEGLLGKAFTATAVIRNYTFDSFISLNEGGRFVIVLDGFDEMKHTLTWEEFRFNFKQINRLVTTGSRVILLGRPTAFLTDEEHMYALHGIHYMHGQILKEPGWPDYKEIHLAPFTLEQIDQFLKGYFSYKESQAVTVKSKKSLQHILQHQLGRISQKHLSDIARRPVQLRMLAEVLPQWKGDINDLTVSLLYSLFIDQIIQRELDKRSRRRFTVKERRKFAQQIAMWLWKNKKEMSVTAEDIPDEIMIDYAKRSENPSTVRRDLVSACFLEKKAGGALYFPHRSFQEFLVAEAIIDRLSTKQLTFDKADELLTPEVASFLVGLSNTSTFKNWQFNLEQYRGALSWNLARVWVSDNKYADYLVERFSATICPWYPLLLTSAMTKDLFPNLSALLIVKLLLKKIKEKKSSMYSLLCYLCIAIIEQRQLPDNSLVTMTEALNTLCSYVTYAAAEPSLHIPPNPVVIKEVGHPTHKKKRRPRQIEYYPPVISTVDPNIGYFLSRTTINKRRGEVDLGGTYKALSAKLKTYCILSDWLIGETIRPEDIPLPAKITLPADLLLRLETVRTVAVHAQ